MKPRYLQSDSSGRDRWTVSYVDVLTILLVFFIAVAAKLPVVAKQPAPQPEPKQVSTPELKPEPHPVLQEAQETLAEAGLNAHLEDRGLVVSLPQTILFAAGDDKISKDAFPVIEQIVDAIGKLPNRVILCGHADSTPVHGRFRSNWELSAARSLRILELLVERYGIDESRLSVSSDGANRPVASNDTPDGRATNRRVEIVIVK